MTTRLLQAKSPIGILIIALAGMCLAAMILAEPVLGSGRLWLLLALGIALVATPRALPLLHLPSLSLAEWAWAIMIAHTVVLHSDRPTDDLVRDQSLTAEIAAQVAIWLLCLSLATLHLVRHPRRFASLVGPSVKWLSLLLLLAICSAGWSLGPLITLAWAIKLLSILLLGCVLSSAKDPISSVKCILRATYVGLLLMLAQFLLFVAISPSAALSTDFETGVVRAGGTIIPPTQLAAAAALVVTISLVRLLACPARRVSLIVLGISAALLVASLGRGGMIACLFSVILVLFIYRRLRLATVILAGTAFLLIATPGLLESSWDLITRREDPVKIFTLTGRTMIWEIAFERFLERPLLGWGYVAGTRIGLLQPFKWWAGADAHNAYIEMLVNLGLIGTMLLLMLLIRLSLTAVRLIRIARSTTVTSGMRPELISFSALLLALLIQGMFEQSFSGAPRFGALLLTALAFCSDTILPLASAPTKAPVAASNPHAAL